jgi:hypothetical protein
MNLFSPLPPETGRMLDDILPLVEKTFPLPGRFRQALPRDVAELSRLFTGGKNERSLSYPGRPGPLSAYLRYFLPWNLYRLCRLLPALSLGLAENDAITDLGSGPLTFTAALWICRPDLRTLPLEFRCIDRSGPILDAGKKLFAALAGNSPWKIRTIRGDINAGAAMIRGKPAALVCAVNVFNEMYAVSHDAAEPLRQAEHSAGLLAGFALPSASILVVEPGVPHSGRFISLLRGALLKRKRPPLSPCPHRGPCPFPGGISKTGKTRWCHFAFETGGAPAALRRLSAAAGIPKERAVLSFLLAGPADPPDVFSTEQAPPQKPIRIISDAFPLPGGRHGRYGCSEWGLVLITGDQKTIENTFSGSLIAGTAEPGRRDPKSGALIVPGNSELEKC